MRKYVIIRIKRYIAKPALITTSHNASRSSQLQKSLNKKIKNNIERKVKGNFPYKSIFGIFLPEDLCLKK